MNIRNDYCNYIIETASIKTNAGNVYFYRINPPNLSIMDADERDAAIARFASLLGSFDDNRCLKIFAADKLEDLSQNAAYIRDMNCPEPLEPVRENLLRLIDDEQRRGDSVHRAFYFILGGDETGATDFETKLAVNGWDFYRAERDEIANLLRNYYLHEYINFNVASFDEKITEIYEKTRKKSAREAYIGNALTRRLTPRRVTFRPDKIAQNDFYRRIFLIKNFPSELSRRCCLADLFKLKNTAISLTLQRLSPQMLNKLVDRQLQNLHSGLFENKRTKAMQASSEYELVGDFYRSLSSDGSTNKVFYINILIEVNAPDEDALKVVSEKVESIVMRQGITLELLTYEQREAFLAINPINTRFPFRGSANNLPASTISWLYPFSYSTHNDPEGVPLGHTADGGAMFIDFKLRDRYTINGHFIITGETGYGKSHLMKKIISMLYFCGVGAFVLSPNNEYSEMFSQLGGTVIDCASGSVKINPFDIRCLSFAEEHEDSELDAFRQSAAFWQHLSWLRDFYTVIFPGVEREELDSLMFFTKRMYSSCGINESSDISKLTPSNYPIFGNLYDIVQKSLDNKEDCLVSVDMRKKLLLLLHDVSKGALSFLFNGHTNIDNANFICFELQSLLAGSKDRSQAVIFNIMSWIWNRITARERFFLFAIDELYMLVNKHNPVIVRYCNEFIKQFRKFKGIMGTATQQIHDILDKDIVHETAALFNSPAHKFLLNPGQLDTHELNRILQLSAGEKGCIENLRRGECLYKRANQSAYHVIIDKLPYEDELYGKGGDG